MGYIIRSVHSSIRCFRKIKGRQVEVKMSDQYKMCFAPIPMHPSYQSTRGLGFGPQNMNSTRKESYVVYRKKIDLRYNIYTSLYLTFVFQDLKTFHDRNRNRCHSKGEIQQNRTNKCNREKQQEIWGVRQHQKTLLVNDSNIKIH